MDYLFLPGVLIRVFLSLSDSLLLNILLCKSAIKPDFLVFCFFFVFFVVLPVSVKQGCRSAQLMLLQKKLKPPHDAFIEETIWKSLLMSVLDVRSVFFGGGGGGV